VIVTLEPLANHSRISRTAEAGTLVKRRPKGHETNGTPVLHRKKGRSEERLQPFDFTLSLMQKWSGKRTKSLKSTSGKAGGDGNAHKPVRTKECQIENRDSIPQRGFQAPIFERNEGSPESEKRWETFGGGCERKEY